MMRGKKKLGIHMVLTWINYLCVVAGSFNFLILIIITAIVLKRSPTEKINWLIAISFFFISLAYLFLPLGAFIYTQENPTPMEILTKIYTFTLFIGIVLLMFSSLAINYGTYFALRWVIVVPASILTIAVGIMLFVFNSVEAVGGENADVKTSLFFMATFYPICIIMVTINFVFFGKAYKNSIDENIRLCLKLFLTGFAFCIFSLIPNILSNVLAVNWENAQIFNAIEFIIVSVGIAFLLGGFLIRSREFVRADTKMAIA
ncbi:MAG: hypothetical protein JXA54_07185 [Candidatus Heimdallarchaeota archaeon]|nr:hypothetical protein [Candidatus Heimdallarchaeota archaeon]